MKPRSIVAILSALTTCSMAQEVVSHTFVEKVSGRGTVELTGWAKLRGELMIYPDRESMNAASKFPYCISGVFSNQAEMKLLKYDGKLVSLTGVLYDYSDLPNEQRPLLQRKMLADSVVPNFCFGSKVILIKTISLVPSSHAPKTRS